MPKVSQERSERPSPVKADCRTRVKTEPRDELPSLKLSAEQSQSINDEPPASNLQPRDHMSTHQEISTKREDTGSEEAQRGDEGQEFERRSIVKHESPEHFTGDAEISGSDSEDDTMTLINQVHSPEFDNYGPSIRRSDWLPKNRPAGQYKRYCRHAFYTDREDQYQSLQFWDKNNDDGRPYHYSDYDGSIFFRNADQSNYYYNAAKGTSRFTFPNGMIIVSNNPNMKAERELYCFPCNALD